VSQITKIGEGKMSLLKYRVGQMVEWATGGRSGYSTIKFRSTTFDENIYIIDDKYETPLFESEIKQAVKYVPDPDPYTIFCKDCKHCIITEEKEEGEDWGNSIPTQQLRFEGCPVSDWFESVWMIDDDFYKYGGFICNLKILQPPPESYCFDPKPKREDE